MQTDLSVGILEPRRDGEGASPSSHEPVTAWDEAWQARWRSQQCGVVRYNCADSLDRTNAASYFAAVQVKIASWLICIGISITLGSSSYLYC